MSEYDCNKCKLLLEQKYSELNKERFPKKSDFSADELIAIKAFLGPWPRALEKAGVKDINPEKEELKKQKRIAKKRRDTQRKVEKTNEKQSN